MVSYCRVISHTTPNAKKRIFLDGISVFLKKRIADKHHQPLLFCADICDTLCHLLPSKITEEGVILAMIQECYKHRAADALAYDDMQTENQLAKGKLFIKIIRKQHKYSENFLTHLFCQ